MLSKIIGIVAVILLVIWAIFALKPDSQETTGEPIKIGFSGALTGPVAWLGELYLAGLQPAIEEVNSSGGINGRPIELIVEDNLYSGKGGVDSFNALQSKGVDMIISIGSAPTVPLSPLARDANIPLLVAAVYADILTDNPNAVRMTILPKVDTGITVNDMKSQGIKKIGVIYRNDEFGLANLNAFRGEIEKTDLEIVHEEAFLAGQAEFNTTVLKTLNNDIDAVYVIDLSGLAVIKELKLHLENKDRDLIIYTNVVPHASNLDYENPEVFEGVRMTSMALAVPGTKERREFASLLGVDESIESGALTYEALGYNNVFAIVSVLEKDNDISKFIENFTKFGKLETTAGVFNLDSRDEGFPLVPTVFENGKLKIVE